MNFFNQYKDLFEVPSNTNISNVISYSNRLKLDNQLFLDKPYVPTYKQSHTLNSKLRELKKDYNQFESQVQQLEELDHIPKRSNSRRKQYRNSPVKPQNFQHLDNSSRHHYNRKNKSNIFNYDQAPAHKNYNKRHETKNHDQQPNNNYPPKFKKQQQKHYEQSYGDSPYQNNQKQNASKFSHNQYPSSSQSLNTKKHHQQYYNQQYQQQKQYSQDYTYSEAQSPQKKLLDDLRKQTEKQTSRFLENQKKIQGKMYQENNNVLKQSQINHIFDWKLQQQSRISGNIPESTVPKYKVQNPALEDRSSPIVNSKTNNDNRNSFVIRNRPSANEGGKPNNRNQIVPPHKEHNHMNTNSEAMERRRKAKANIDERREKLRHILKAY